MNDPEVTTPSGECLNCQTPLNGCYCASCGQLANTARLRIDSWSAEVFDLTVSLETRMWRTLVGLTLRPGKTALRYVQGQRVAFTNPVKYAVLTAALWILATSLVNDAAADSSGIAAFLESYGQLANLLAVPVLAVIVHLSFWGSGFTYAEHLCLMLYMSGHVFLWRTLLAGAAGLGAPDVWVMAADLILFLVYSSWVLWSFHAGRVRLMWLRVLGFLFGALLLSFVLQVCMLIFIKLQEG